MPRPRFALSILATLGCLHCSGGSAVDAGPSLTCGPGTHLSGAMCIADPLDAGPSQTCAPGTHLAFGVCVRDPVDAGPLPAGDAGFTDPSTWAANEQVSHDGARAGGEPQVAVDSHGTVYVAYMDVTAPEIGCCVYLMRSPASPHAFAQVARFEATSTSMGYGAPTVAVDGMDRVFFGFVRYARGSAGRNSGTVLVAQSTDGQTFGTPQEVGTHDARYPSNDRPWLTLAPDGSMHVSWSFDSLDYRYPGVGTKYAQSIDGQPFGVEQTAFRPDASVVSFGRTPFGYDSMGNPVVVAAPYSIDSSGAFSYSVQSWYLDPVNWVASTITSLLAERHYSFDAAPALVSDSHGALTAVFLNAISRDVTMYVSRSTDGHTWSAPSLVVPATFPSHAVALPWATVDETDHVHLMWLDNHYGAWVPYTTYSSDGVTFHEPERIGDATFVENGSLTGWIGDSLSLVVRGHQRYAAWTDPRSGQSQVYFSTSPSPL